LRLPRKLRAKPKETLGVKSQRRITLFGTGRATYSIERQTLTLLSKYTFRGKNASLAAAFVVMLVPGAQSQATAPAASSNAGQVSVQPNPNDAGTYATAQPLAVQSNEGFWGHLNPFARKKWVNRQINPVKDRLNELDQLSAKNANEIKDVDQRAQAGIHQAQAVADQASQQASAASATASEAHTLAQQSAIQTSKLSSTVANIDDYHPVSDTEIRFRPGQTTINMKAMDALDGIASQVVGQQGYLIEVQGYSRTKGQAGVQASQQLADSVVRYLVEGHKIPVYRIHVIGMGNAALENSDGLPVSGSAVHVTVVKNSLAASNSSGSSGGSPIGATQQTYSQPSPQSAASSPSAQQQ
jgi:outer membrane protein OmpA-like peptidoglycan-associated protein